MFLSKYSGFLSHSKNIRLIQNSKIGPDVRVQMVGCISTWPCDELTTRSGVPVLSKDSQQYIFLNSSEQVGKLAATLAQDEPGASICLPIRQGFMYPGS